MTARMRVMAGALLAWSAAPSAEEMEFDRPGIAFPIPTLPAGTFAIEQGLPSVERDRDDGLRSTLISADSLVRVGLARNLELQVETALYNRLDTRSAGQRDVQHGVGDLGLALKYRLPAEHERFSWAVLGAVSLTTGDAPIGDEDEAYALGTSLNWALAEAQNLVLYLNAEHGDDGNRYTVSPTWEFAWGETVNPFLEAGHIFTADGADEAFAGAGITWLVRPRVQLDAFGDWGLTEASQDFFGGLGVSLYFGG